MIVDTVNHPPLLEIEDLVVHRGDTLAVDHVSLAVERDQITALLGPSGCGKTSLLRAAAGFERPSHGTVRIDGESVAGEGSWVEPERRRVGMVFQQGALFPHMTVEQNVRYGVEKKPDGRPRARGALELVGLVELSTRFPDQLSGGQQQLVALARALAPGPRIVLLDEPFASLDASLRQRLREDVRRILREAGCTAVLVTHDQQEALSVSDRVAVMHRGRILQIGTPEQVYRRPADVTVARFIGGGQLLACSASGGRLTSELGAVATSVGDGDWRMLVRPEDLDVLPAAAGEGVAARVVRRCYYGHDLILEVELDSGRCLDVRVSAPHDASIGEAVRLRLRAADARLFEA